MVSLGSCVERSEFIGGEAYRDDLHRVGPTAGAATSAAFQALNVVTRLGLIRPLRDLLVTDHAENRMTRSGMAEHAYRSLWPQALDASQCIVAGLAGGPAEGGHRGWVAARTSAAHSILTSSVADGTTAPVRYVESRDGEVPISAAKSAAL